MKKFFITTLLFGSLASGVIAEVSPIQNQVINGESILSISPNGKWMAGLLYMDNSIVIRNLETGQNWKYYWDGTDFGTNYPKSAGRCISDNGIYAGERADIPAYWENGKWTNLKGYVRDSSGNVAARIGGITADGSMIVGGMGKGASIYDEEDGHQFTYPCVWHRLEDGTYSDPEWLPVPGVEFFGLTPQYLHCTDVSLDGNTIAATMRTWNGFYSQTYSYTRDEDGVWTCLELGYEFINPTGMEIPEFPGEYYGPNPPNYEDYMTKDQLYDFYWVSGPEWIDEMLEQGKTEEEIALLELSYAMNFMDPDKKAEYEVILNNFLDRYVTWFEKYEVYIDFLERFGSRSGNFYFNSGLVSPDGKYVYTTGSGGGLGGYTIVRFDARTGEAKTYPNRYGIEPTCILADYSVLGWETSEDSDWPSQAYIFPQGGSTPVAFPDYFRSLGKEDIYDWMEEHMYQSVVVSVTSSGAEQFDDEWSVGMPVATPDFSLIGFGGSTLYWELPQEGVYITHIINTGYDTDTNGIRDIETDDAMLDGGDENAVYYNLQGARVVNPDHGIFIRVSNGKAVKVVL